MTELYEDPARSKQMINRVLNSDVTVNANSLLLIPVYLQLCDLIKNDISMEHVNIINNTWYTYQVLINMSNKTDLKGLKRKIKRFITLRDEILQDMFNQDISLFEQTGRPFTLFGIRDDIIKFSQGLTRKNGSRYSTNVLIKKCYFELLFIAESLGLVAPTQHYQRSELKSFLEIVTTPLLASSESPEATDKTLRYYCQEYEKAKNHPNVKKLISELTKHCIEYRLNATLWQKLLTIYENEIAPLMLTQ
ncbi:hypothetical protein [uncultured Legionella sp.]|uniref:hypothetical protein n=1 Tax=uncultured Legionella sp. TaxID=210934 RepID=UPI00262BF1D8|nr:hypothetical protein [uncultured Legionella sp.]